MFRTGIVFFCLALLACQDKKKNDAQENGFSYEKFSGHFQKLTLPYSLTDVGLLKNKDTTSIQVAGFGDLIPDSLRNKYFGKNNKVKYIALGSFVSPERVNFYLVKAQSGLKKVAFLIAFNKDKYGGIFSFLVPDTDPTTTQASMIDKSFSIQQNVSQKTAGNLAGEGKDVYDYDMTEGKFLLILTNPLNSRMEVSNPIDTFSKKHKFAADYFKDKKNYISVRDGRYPNQLLVYMHLDKNNGGCTGELKGDMLLTTSTTAIYRQGSDPCVLSLRFTASSVTVREDEGCGSHRGIDCLFDGIFTRKKEIKAKNRTKKK